MQGPSHLDLAKTLADEQVRGDHDHRVGPGNRARATSTLRHWVGHHLIHIGERLAPRTSELQLKVSTGPPCP